MPPIPGDWIAAGGGYGLVALAVFLILTGWLVPRSTVKRLEHERDQWQAVALKAMGHADALMPAAHIASEVTRSFAEATATAIEGRRRRQTAEESAT